MSDRDQTQTPAAHSFSPASAPTFGAESLELASWGSRVAATLLDTVIAGIAITIIVFIIISIVHGAIIAVVAEIICLLLYYGLTMARQGVDNGQTLGKQIVKIRVVRDNGEPISFAFALLRELVVKNLFAIILFIGPILDLLWPLWDASNQALHDKVVSTHVVKD